MGFALPVLTLVTVALLAYQANHVDSEPSGMEQFGEASLISNIAPVSFEERKIRRKRQARDQRARIPPPVHKEGNTIMSFSIPNCVEEGMVLMQGYDNYFVHCIANHVHGGFYRVIYICPTGLRSVEDTSMCIPPPDCSECGGGLGFDDLGYNGNKPTVSTVTTNGLEIARGIQTASLNANGRIQAQSMGHRKQQIQHRQNTSKMEQNIRKQAVTTRASQMSSKASHRAATTKIDSSSSSHSSANSMAMSQLLKQSITASQVEPLSTYLPRSDIPNREQIYVRLRTQSYQPKVAKRKYKPIHHFYFKLRRLRRNVPVSFTHFQKHEVSSTSKTIHHQRIASLQDEKDKHSSLQTPQRHHHNETSFSQSQKHELLTKNLSRHDNMSSSSQVKHELSTSSLNVRNMSSYLQHHGHYHYETPSSGMHPPHYDQAALHVHTHEVSSSSGKHNEQKHYAEKTETNPSTGRYQTPTQNLKMQKKSLSSSYGHHKEVINSIAKNTYGYSSQYDQPQTIALPGISHARRHELSSSYGQHKESTMSHEKKYDTHGLNQNMDSSFAQKHVLSSYGNQKEQKSYLAQLHNPYNIGVGTGFHQNRGITHIMQKQDDSSAFGYNNYFASLHNRNHKNFISPTHQRNIGTFNTQNQGLSSHYNHHQKHSTSNMQHLDIASNGLHPGMGAAFNPSNNVGHNSYGYIFNGHVPNTSYNYDQGNYGDQFQILSPLPALKHEIPGSYFDNLVPYPYRYAHTTY